MNIAHWLHQSVLSWPNRPALHDGNNLFATYKGLGQRTVALARWLDEAQGIKRTAETAEA